MLNLVFELMMNVFSRKPDPREGGEESDPVWNLLGRSPLSEPDAWFAARTLARCRNAVAEARVPILNRAWRWGTGAGFAVCLVLLVTQVRPHHHSAARVAAALPVSKQKRVQEAFEIVASMGPDADPAANNSPWQDTSL